MAGSIRQIICVLITFFCLTSVGKAITLETVKQRGIVRCGVMAGQLGFSNPDAEGNWSGLNVEICRAVAAAVLGDASKVKFVPVSGKNGVTALQTGDVELLSTNIPWSLNLDTSLGVHFVGVSFYDGQSFLVSRKLGVKNAMELGGAEICLADQPGVEAGLARFFSEHGLNYRSKKVNEPDQFIDALNTGRCLVVTGKRSALFTMRRELDNPDEYVMLPEVITRAPFGPIVRHGDDGWFNVVRWTLFALFIGEEQGVSSNNIDEMKAGTDPDVKKLLGEAGSMGKGLGLSDDWAYQVLKQVGNYGEVFDKTVGLGSPLKMERGINGLWNRGGLHYAPSLQ